MVVPSLVVTPSEFLNLIKPVYPLGGSQNTNNELHDRVLPDSQFGHMICAFEISCDIVSHCNSRNNNLASPALFFHINLTYAIANMSLKEEWAYYFSCLLAAFHSLVSSISAPQDTELDIIPRYLVNIKV